MKKTCRDPVCGMPIIIDCSTAEDLQIEMERRHINIDCARLRYNAGHVWTLTQKDGGDARVLVWINKDEWTASEGPAVIAHECLHMLMYINEEINGTPELKLDSESHEYAAYHLSNLYTLVWDVVARTVGKEKV